MYQAKFGWRPWRLDLLLLLFLHQGKKRRSWGWKNLSNGTFFSFLEKRKEAKETQALCRGRGSFSGYIGNGRKSPNWLASLTPWSSFAFFSSIKRRKEDHVAGKIFLMGPSFLSLRKEKKQKKLKPSAEGGEVFPGTSEMVESPQIGWRPWRLDLLLPSFLLSREEKKIMWPEKSF